MSRQWHGAAEKNAEPSTQKIELLLRELVNVVADGAEFGAVHLPDSSEDILLDIFVDGARYMLIRTHPKPGAGVTLSPREMEIARMVAEGYSNKTISEVLDISSWTVGTHLRRIFAKLGVRTRAAMVMCLSEGRLLKEQPAVNRAGRYSASLE